jgi:ABC-type Fe3+ transport system permease subunit
MCTTASALRIGWVSVSGSRTSPEYTETPRSRSQLASSDGSTSGRVVSVWGLMGVSSMTGMPGITIGLAFVFVGIRLVPGWYQETPLLILAYGVLFLPLAIAGVRAGVAAAPPRLEEVSRSLGKGSAATHARVTLPLATPGIAAGAALVFLTAAKELPATLLLRPNSANTLATEMWALTSRMLYGAAAPYAVALILIATIPALLLGFTVVERTRKERRTFARLAALIGRSPRTR